MPDYDASRLSFWQIARDIIGALVCDLGVRLMSTQCRQYLVDSIRHPEEA